MLFARGDPRAINLAAVFLLIGTSFADPLISKPSLSISPIWRIGLQALSKLQPEAFLPFFFWGFVRDFPRSLDFSRAARFFRSIIGVSIIVGFVLLVANAATLIPLFAPDSAEGLTFITPLVRRRRESYFWTILFALILPALPFAVWKSRAAPLEERRRVRLFLTALAAGSLPLPVDVVLEQTIPSFKAFMNVPLHERVGAFVVYSFLISIPLATAYSVLVHRVLEVRLVVRKVIQYALARYTVLTAGALPFMVLIVYLYQHRGETLSGLLSGAGALVLLAATIIGAVMYHLRETMVGWIDRRFFREQYDAHRILGRLAGKSRSAGSREELATMWSTETTERFILNRLPFSRPTTRNLISCLWSTGFRL